MNRLRVLIRTHGITAAQEKTPPAARTPTYYCAAEFGGGGGLSVGGAGSLNPKATF